MLALDHIVIASKDPAHAAHQLALQHGIKIVEGGRHEFWGTYNYLAYFANDCYVEWLGIFDKPVAEQSSNPLIKQLVTTLQQNEELPVQIALRTDHLGKFIDQFQASSLKYTGPVAGHRRKPDGTNLSWKMLFLQGQSNLPFLIEWDNHLNKPDNAQFLNKQQIKSVAYPFPSDNFNNIYQEQIKNDGIILANTYLHLRKEKEIDFQIK
ncbi:VOC family protein [Virgibacillus salarius]|uniref:VOC family protein n=1 Tax=Virgibacillus salarius TaxID=447199 RepID=UPI00248F59B5|nr:VOC family protein [Virgibacillus salarius]WBX80686.1 VOC family protein [Virgibacillus salarius]